MGSKVVMTSATPMIDTCSSKTHNRRDSTGSVKRTTRPRELLILQSKRAKLSLVQVEGTDEQIILLEAEHPFHAPPKVGGPPVGPWAGGREAPAKPPGLEHRVVIPDRRDSFSQCHTVT